MMREPGEQSQSERIGFGSNRLDSIFVETEAPIALESPDHLQPCGTAHDNSRNARFNAKLYQLYTDLGRPLRILDLGCSGGGFVRECIDDGCIAVGIEGSDYSARMARAEWGVLGGKFLFTADITKPFRVRAVWDGQPSMLSFDVITAWEVFEHIARKDVAAVCANIRSHLGAAGLVILSICGEPHAVNGIELHQTVENRNWWLDAFRANGLYHQNQLVAYFGDQFVRGPRQNTPGSFHLILASREQIALSVPHRSRRHRLLDRWYGSAPYRLLRKSLNIDSQ